MLGKMEENMKDSIIWIRNKDSEYFPGLMAKNILVSGRMVSNMEGENLLVREDMKRQGFGKMVKELDGLLMNCDKNDIITIKTIQLYYQYPPYFQHQFHQIHREIA